MAKGNNYAVHAFQAKQRFLGYDQEKVIQKLKLKHDETYLYPVMLATTYRLSRATGDLERLEGDVWQDANTYGEIMTLLDLVCDSREDRFVSGRWKDMAAFGLMFHTNLLEGRKDPLAELFQEKPDAFRRACGRMQGTPLPNGDICYAIDLFDGLPIAIQLWFGDDEFPPNLRLMWDENALMYLKYETMHFAKGMLLDRLKQMVEEK